MQPTRCHVGSWAGLGKNGSGRGRVQVPVQEVGGVSPVPEQDVGGVSPVPEQDVGGVSAVKSEAHGSLVPPARPTSAALRPSQECTITFRFPLIHFAFSGSSPSACGSDSEKMQSAKSGSFDI
jgi:hypothetical protein